MKINPFLFTSFLFALSIFVSCVDSSSSSDEPLSSNAQITKVTLVAKDSISQGLGKVYFSIDQLNGLIENLDSLPDSVATKLAKYKFKYIKVKIDFVAASKVTIEYGPEDNQKFDYPKTDSIDFTRPVKIRVFAIDNTEKLYEFKINIHTQNPEKLVWRSIPFDGWSNMLFNDNKTVAFNGQFFAYQNTTSGFTLFTAPMTNGGTSWTQATQNLPETAQIESMTKFGNKLYIKTSTHELWSSADGFSWTKVELTKDVYAIYGSLVDKSGSNHLIVLTSENSNFRFASISENGTLSLCGDVNLPDDFPVSGFATINKTIGLTEKLTLIAGKDKNGNFLNSVQQIYWDNSGFQCGYNMENGRNWFNACESPIAYYYDNKMVISCGRESTEENNNTYYSTDYGLSWTKDTTHLYPKEFTPRANSSVVVDSKNFIWIFGGRNMIGDRAPKGISEIWCGRLNRLGFIRQ